MTLLHVQNIQKAFAGETVLLSAGFALNKGEKVGLVGQNGCGKTTLLNIAAGIVTPDAGQRTVAGRLSLGILSQTPEFSGARTVLDAAARAQEELSRLEGELEQLSKAMAGAEGEELDRLIKRHTLAEERYRMLGGYASRGRVEAVLKGIGFKIEDFDKAPGVLSGGEAKRLQLAMVLLGGHDILFLDEPGNHLDLAGTEWLTGFLNDYPGSVMVVSHDRYLLNGMADRIIQLKDGRTYDYKGNYDRFLEAFQVRMAESEKKKENHDRIKARGEEFIRRNFYGQKARLAKSKRKMLDRLEAVETIRPPEYASIRFEEAATTFDHVIRLEGLGAEVGGKILFRNLSLDLEMGETLGVIGPNGCGKSTLLKIVMGLLPPASGGVWTSPRAAPLYFDQQLEGLKTSGTVLDEMRTVLPLATDGELRSHLGRYLFRGDEVEKAVADLSGGERSRALLAKRTLTKANFLVLDEPTNHLDIYMRESLEDALSGFAGAVVIVSHDRYLLDGIVDKLLVLGLEKPMLHLGGYSAYMEQLARETLETKPVKVKKKPGTRTAPPRVKRKHTFDELETLIFAHEERLREIEKEIYKEEVYMDHRLCQKLEEESQTLKRELEELYEEWNTWA